MNKLMKGLSHCGIVVLLSAIGCVIRNHPPGTSKPGFTPMGEVGRDFSLLEPKGSSYAIGDSGLELKSEIPIRFIEEKTPQAHVGVGNVSYSATLESLGVEGRILCGESIKDRTNLNFINMMTLEVLRAKLQGKVFSGKFYEGDNYLFHTARMHTPEGTFFAVTVTAAGNPGKIVSYLGYCDDADQKKQLVIVSIAVSIAKSASR